jgi:hypothetical protein
MMCKQSSARPCTKYTNVQIAQNDQCSKHPNLCAQIGSLAPTIAK